VEFRDSGEQSDDTLRRTSEASETAVRCPVLTRRKARLGARRRVSDGRRTSLVGFALLFILDLCGYIYTMADDPVNVAGRAGKNKRNFFGRSNTARAIAGDPAELHPSGPARTLSTPAWSPRHNRWVGASARYGVTGGKARARCEGVRRPDRVGWGGWTRPRSDSPRPLLSLSSPTEERESPVYANFFW
jgi:hypothetical protein